MTWMQTRNGKKFDLLNPNSDAVDILEIAVCLSRKARFGGHTTVMYSVAQHSVHVCDLVETADLRLHALLHDAHEVYSGFGDVLSPAKRLDRKVTAFIEVHHALIDRAIAEKFGIDSALFYEPAIKLADLIAIATERRDLKAKTDLDWGPLPDPDPRPIVPMNEQQARTEFLAKFEEMTQ